MDRHPGSNPVALLVSPNDGVLIFEFPAQHGLVLGQHELAFFIKAAQESMDTVQPVLAVSVPDDFSALLPKGCFWVLRTGIGQCFGVVWMAIDKESKWLNQVLTQCSERLLPWVLQAQLSVYRKVKWDNNRLLELSVLYETSYSLGHSLNYYHIITQVFDAIIKVLTVDIASILVLGFAKSGDGELIVRATRPVDESLIKGVHQNVLRTVVPFLGKRVDRSRINFVTQTQYENEADTPVDSLRSFVNIPLVFKDTVLGLLNVSTHQLNAYTQNELTFLHTMANQLSSHLGRLKLVRELEQTKIGAMIGSMAEGVIMLDENHHLEVINPAAKGLLGFATHKRKILPDVLLSRLQDLGVLDLFYDSVLNRKQLLDQELSSKDKILSANVSPVMSADNSPLGTVMVLRDVTRVRSMSLLNQQRLSIINEVAKILNSITDLEKLLEILVDFILSVVDAQMGSIQLKMNEGFVTKVHSNFPDKIRLEYRFLNGETISRSVIKSQQACVILDYETNSLVQPNPKVAITSYVCIPIQIKQELIGLVNIVQKAGVNAKRLTNDDIETLQTITSLSGAAIHNAILIQETLQTQKLDQELQVAFDIQRQLLPDTLPESKIMSFGAISRPARAIGGDYYDFFDLGSGKIGVVVADIVGKGVPAALFMAMFKTLIQSMIRDYHQPGDLFNQLNTVICQERVFSRYIPAFYGVMDMATRSFSYCNAGHEPGLWFRPKRVMNLSSMGLPLGADETVIYDDKTIQLSKSDMICLFTDGIIEARDANGKSYGYTRLKKRIQSGSALPADRLVDSIYQDVDQFMGVCEQHDDLTLLLMNGTVRVDVSDQVIDTLRFKVKSKKSDIAIVRDKMDVFCEHMGFSESDRFDIKLAVNEAQANIIEHVYSGQPSGDISFLLQQFADRVVITIKDYGSGTKKRSTKGEKDLDVLEGSGLGVFLMSHLMDDVDYASQTYLGSELVMTKYLTKPRR